MREFKFRAWDGEKYLHFDLFNVEGFIAKDIHQFTSLKDKNGKDVYEGDLVRVGEFDEVHEVRFDCGGFMAGEMFLDDYWNMYGYMFEVIGNKFENPKLLLH